MDRGGEGAPGPEDPVGFGSENLGQDQRGCSREGRRWDGEGGQAHTQGPSGTAGSVSVLRAKMGRPDPPSSVGEKGLWLQGALPLFSGESFLTCVHPVSSKIGKGDSSWLPGQGQGWNREL